MPRLLTAPSVRMDGATPDTALERHMCRGSARTKQLSQELIRMHIMTDPVIIRRIPRGNADRDVRIGLSTVLRLDVDLVLGADYEIPENLTDEQRREALLLCFTEEYARTEALRDMADVGFADVPHAIAQLATSSLIDEMEDDDNRRGPEAEPPFQAVAA